MERRREPRISAPFPVSVCNRRQDGELIFDTLLDNLSARGLYFHVPGALCEHAAALVRLGVELLFIVKMPPVGAAAPEPVARLALRGIVQRLERQPDGVYGVGVRVKQHRFL